MKLLGSPSYVVMFGSPNKALSKAPNRTLPPRCEIFWVKVQLLSLSCAPTWPSAELLPQIKHCDHFFKDLISN